MKRTLPAILCIVAVLFFLLSPGPSLAERIVRLSDRQVIDFKELIAEVRGARLVFIGEDHDRMEDHWRQLRIIKALNDTGVPLAIGLEMFTAENQGILDKWVAGEMDEATFSARYLRNWDIPWDYYRDIFHFARRHGIPLVGLNLPREVVHKVASRGFATLSPEERKRIPAGVTCNVDNAYIAMVRRAFAGHAGNRDLFVHFCEAQMLWNKSMARRLVEYGREHPGRTIVVLAGSGHATRPGIPGEVAAEADPGQRVILPEDAAFNRDTVTAADADYLVER
ncbi:MAG TPA: ChaN family lipoprotein [Geobacteraceae bacterium]